MTEEAKEEFMSALSNSITRATKQSYNATLDRFVAVAKRLNGPADQPTVETAATFIELEAQSKAPKTIRGEISVISNFLAYLHGANASVVRARIHAALEERQGHAQEPPIQPPQRRDEKVTRSVEQFLSQTRESHYGTRTHAIVELIASTGCRLTTAQQANIEDYWPDDNEIGLSASKTHVVSSCDEYGLTAQLPSDVVEVLDTYIEHERIDCQAEDCEPLFTTRNGRVSTHAIQAAVNRINEQCSSTPGQRVTAGKIRRYALDQV